MIGLDTHILARYYVQEESDAEAKHQHKSARKLIESGEPLSGLRKHGLIR